MEIKTAICVDPMGSSIQSPEEEIKALIEVFNEDYLKPHKVNPYQIYAIDESTIEPGTKLVLFDFGGMMMGNSLMETNSRSLVKWALDHPSSLVCVVSQCTWSWAIQYELQDLGLDSLPNLVLVSHFDFKVPKWFMDSLE